MLFVPTAQFLAADAQRRHFADATFAGPTSVGTAQPSRFSVVRRFGRNAVTASRATAGRRQFA